MAIYRHILGDILCRVWFWPGSLMLKSGAALLGRTLGSDVFCTCWQLCRCACGASRAKGSMFALGMYA